MSISYEDLSQRILSLDLIDLGKLRDVENSFGAQAFTTDQILVELQRRGYLTKYQVERLTSGETTGFYYGDYRILYLIGAGSFARVFRCVNKKTGQVVAVKVLRARFREDKTAIDEFVREGELGMQMRHPNIPAIYEAGHTKYDHYIVMEFVEGRTLREELTAQKNHRLEPKRATRIVHDVCSALDYALKRGYQHRDMKLSNILLSSSGKAMLLDFGLLTDEGSGFKTQRAIEYAALERSTHVPRDDKRSDLYFLGSVYYQLLTGIAPLGEIKERSKRLDASRFKNVKPIREVAPYVPRCVAYVVDKAMKFDPTERYQAPSFMLEGLDAAIKALEAGVDVEQEEKVMTAALKEKKTKLGTVMIVEANAALQNAFREAFKNAGYRALVMSNCERALGRLDDGDAVGVDAIIFNAQSLGADAVRAFNKLLESNTTKDLPAIVLLEENQVKWAAAAKRGKKRLAVGMPITMKRLLMVVEKLIQPEPEPLPEKEPETATTQTPTVPASKSAPSAEETGTAKSTPEKPSGEQVDDIPDEILDQAFDSAFDHFQVDRSNMVPADAGGAEKTNIPKTEEKKGDIEPVVFDDPDADSYIED
ncbi:MAG: protein kinase [Thermoguttaceae bacterium]